MLENSSFPPIEAGNDPIGTIESRLEDTQGIVALLGHIDITHETELSVAIEGHLANPAVEYVVFDFENTSFFHSELLVIIVDTHNKTMKSGKKKMKLRSIKSYDILSLLEATGLDKPFALEGIDDLEGADAWKLKYRSFKPAS